MNGIAGPSDMANNHGSLFGSNAGVGPSTTVILSVSDMVISQCGEVDDTTMCHWEDIIVVLL